MLSGVFSCGWLFVLSAFLVLVFWMAAFYQGLMQVQHVFCNYGAGVRFVRFYHSGKDTQFWAGRYGAKMTGGCVRLLNLPEGTK